jgi:hypothetical protein
MQHFGGAPACWNGLQRALLQGLIGRPGGLRASTRHVGYVGRLIHMAGASVEACGPPYRFLRQGRPADPSNLLAVNETCRPPTQGLDTTCN